MSGVHVSLPFPSSLSLFLNFLPPSRSLLSQGMGMSALGRPRRGAAGVGVVGGGISSGGERVVVVVVVVKEAEEVGQRQCWPRLSLHRRSDLLSRLAPVGLVWLSVEEDAARRESAEGGTG
jgi:hypothetical protein